MEDDRCVCCGEYVPEGRQVCWGCENGDVRGHRSKLNLYYDDFIIDKDELEEALKSFEQMKWTLGDMHKSLKWYQKLNIWFDYMFCKLKFWR